MDAALYPLQAIGLRPSVDDDDTSTKSLDLGMEKYRLIRQEQVLDGSGAGPPEGVGENEVYVTSHGKMSAYLTSALSKLETGGETSLTFRATGKAINKLVSVVEVVKRRVASLHQVTETGTVRNREHYEPLEEGLKPVVNDKSVSSLTIVLSRNPLDADHVGYQAPLTEEDRATLGEEDRDGVRNRAAR